MAYYAFWRVAEVAKTEKVLKVISKTLSTVLISVVVLLAVLLAGVRLIGLTPYTVLSGSMEPKYHVGSIIYVTDVDVETLKEGDPVTYRIEGGTVVTHRIEKVFNKGTSHLSFQTKGDANKQSDGEIPASAVIGKPCFSIPYLGYVSNFVQKPYGLVTVIGCSGAVLIISFVIDSLLSKTEEGSTPLKSEGEDEALVEQKGQGQDLGVDQ